MLPLPGDFWAFATVVELVYASAAFGVFLPLDVFHLWPRRRVAA